MARPLKIFGVHLENSAVSYYRMWLPFDELNRQGLCECERFPDDVGRTTVPFLRASSNYSKSIGSFEDVGEGRDMIVFQRMELLEHLSLTRALKAMYGVPMVAECDDDLWSVQPSSNAYKKYRTMHPGENLTIKEISPQEVHLYDGDKRGRVIEEEDGKYYWITLEAGGNFRDNFTEFVRESEGVTTTTEVLADVFRQYNPYVHILPNCLDVPRWKQAGCAPKRKTDRVCVAWLGGIQHFDDLYLLKEVIPDMLRANPKIDFLTTMAVPEFWEKVADEFPNRFFTVPFAPIQSWPEHLGGLGIDIGLAPLNGAKFNRSKSNLKYIEFAALGIPAVFSPLPPYAEVDDGRTGFHAANEKDWVDCILRLAEDAGCRKKVGKAAQEHVFGEYDIAKKAIMWKDAYEEIYNRSIKHVRREAERTRESMAK